LRGRSAVIAIACALVLASVGPAVGQERTEPGDGEPARPGGAQALLASAAYPGLGQLMNGTELKAAVVGAAGAFLGARLLLEDRWTRHSLRRYRETGDSDYFDEYSEHFDRRQTLMWWAIVAALYGIADAYVDAHLADFNEPISPSLEGVLGGSSLGDPSAIRVGVALRF
jgi:hypothetical protein